MERPAIGTASRRWSWACLLVVAACGAGPEGPEAELRAWVDAMHAAAEERDRRSIVARIAPSYADARGNDRDSIDDLLRVYFLRQSDVAVIPSISEVRVIDDSAGEMLLTVAMAGRNDSLLGISADAYRFELELVKRGGDWLLISARWAEVGQPLR